MKTLISKLIAVGTLCLAVSASAGNSWREPEDFRGLKWGSSPEEMKGQICPPYGPGELLGTRTKSKDPRIRYFSCAGYVRIGPVPSSLIFTFLDNKLSGIDMTLTRNISGLWNRLSVNATVNPLISAIMR